MLDAVGARDRPTAGGGQRIVERRKTQIGKPKNKQKNKEKARGNNRSQPSLDGGGGSMQGTKTDLTQDPTQWGKLLQKGLSGKKRQRGKTKSVGARSSGK
jgi:hypothetical protein